NSRRLNRARSFQERSTERRIPPELSRRGCDSPSYRRSDGRIDVAGFHHLTQSFPAGYTIVCCGMKILITGICGFVGSSLARWLKAASDRVSVLGIDNLIRPGSEVNRSELLRMDIEVQHGDVRAAADLESVGEADWVIDAAANPSVLAGVDGRSSSRQLIEH